MSSRITSIRRRLRAATWLGALLLAACAGDDLPSMIAAGKAAAAKNDQKAAAIQFKRALQKDATSAEARFLLGQSLLESGDPVGAQVELRKALEQKTPADQVQPLLARADLMLGDYRKVVTTFASMSLADKTAQASLQVSMASAWAALGDDAKAVAAIDAALAAAPEFGPALILRARQLASGGDLAGARQLLDKTLAREPGLKEAWVLKGDVAVMSGQDAQQAEASYREASKLDKTYIPAYASLVASRLREHDLAGAKTHSEQLKAAVPNHPIALMLDAQIAFFEGNLAHSRELMQQLMQRAPNNVAVLQLAGAIEARSHAPIKAETHYTKALQLNPDLVPARRGLVQIYLDLGQPAKAMATLQPLLAKDGNSLETLTLAGNAQLALGDAAAAEGWFSRAAKVAPDDLRVKTAVAVAQLSRADPSAAFAELGSLAVQNKDIYAEQAIVTGRLKRREYAAALTAVEQMQKKQPDSAAVLELRGRVLLASKDYPAARKAFEQVLKIDPTLFSAISNLAALDLLDGKPDEAGKRLEASIKADPRNIYALMSLAELKSTRGAPLEEVRKLLTDAVAQSPQTPEPRLQLIGLLLRKRLHKDALVAAQEAAAALPGNPFVMDAVGRAQMEAGDVEQAIATFRRLAGAESSSALPYVRLADIYRTLNKREQAEAMLKKALEIEPAQAQAQAALVDLLLQGKRGSDAIDYVRRLQKEQPGNPVPYRLEAVLQVRLKSPEGALVAYRTGVAKTQDGALARELHRMLYDANRIDEADRFGAAWQKEHPQDSAFEYELSIADYARQRYDRSEVRLAHLVAANPDNVLALNNLASVMIKRGTPGALKYAQKAAELAPGNLSVMDTLAAALAAERQFDKALSTQKRVVELAPANPDMRLNLARIALQAGDKPLARGELDRLKALGASFGQHDEVDRLMKTL